MKAPSRLTRLSFRWKGMKVIGFCPRIVFSKVLLDQSIFLLTITCEPVVGIPLDIRLVTLWGIAYGCDSTYTLRMLCGENSR